MLSSNKRAQTPIAGFIVLLLGVTAIIGFILVGPVLKSVSDGALSVVDDGFVRLIIIVFPFVFLLLLIAGIYYGLVSGGG